MTQPHPTTYIIPGSGSHPASPFPAVQPQLNCFVNPKAALSAYPETAICTQPLLHEEVEVQALGSGVDVLLRAGFVLLTTASRPSFIVPILTPALPQV